MKSLLRKLNWRLIVVHFLAIWLCMDAFRIFANLYDYRFLHILHYTFVTLHSSPKAMQNLHLKYPDTQFGARLAENMFRMALLQLVGLIGAFLISLAVTLKMRWFGLNSVLAFIAGVALFIGKRVIYGKITPIYYISYIQYIFPNKLNSIWGFGTTALIALILAILLLFSPFTIRFIEKGAYRPMSTDPVHLATDEASDDSDSTH